MTITMTLSAEEREIEAFERLKPQLNRVWDIVFPGDKHAYTTVIVPSLTLDQEQMSRLTGAAFYEERLLFLLMRLRNPQARVVYVTSQPVHPKVLDYYLQLLAGVAASHARARLTLLCAYDASPRPLTQKILERPRLIQRIRESIHDPSLAYLTVFNSTPLERSLAVQLGIPMNAPDPRLVQLGTKSGSRRLFREAGIALPYGHEDLATRTDIVQALDDIRRTRPNVRRALLKFNESFSGEGNARFDYPESTSRGALHDAIEQIRPTAHSQCVDEYLARFESGGGIVEEMIEANEVRSPSAQIRINPRGDIIPASTHDQILGGPDGQIFLGCLFPADESYRREVADLGRRVGRALQEHGVIGRFSVDFLASRNAPADRWNLSAIEINLRMGGTTHPMLALRFLTGGELDRESGALRGIDGREKFYKSSDNLQSERYRGLLPDDLLDIVALHRLEFNHHTCTGVLFHMIGAVSQFGKFGMIAIGNSRDEADALFERTVQVLDTETTRRFDV